MSCCFGISNSFLVIGLFKLLGAKYDLFLPFPSSSIYSSKGATSARATSGCPNMEILVLLACQLVCPAPLEYFIDESMEREFAEYNVG